MPIHSHSFRCWLAALLVVVISPEFVSAQETQPAPSTPAPTPRTTNVPLTTPQSQACYGIGRQIGRDLASGGLEGDLLDVNALVLGIHDALSMTDSRVSQEDFQAAVSQVQQVAQQRLQQKMQALGERNRREGPKFLERYKATQGVKQTASGVLYKVLKQGTGPSPQPTDIVRTHYRGRLIDGSEFDSSYKRNQPAEFPVDGVIPGWTEALQMMKVGDHWQMAIPPELAYGTEGNPPVIGPDAVLIFDIELLGIVDPAQQAEQADAALPQPQQ
jgi:FKBP-type peptidyl-prolyl cis-trans isomerase